MHVIFLGSTMDGQQHELPDGCESYDVEDAKGRIRYIKKVWVTPPRMTGKPHTESIYFVPSTLEEKEQEALIAEHLRMLG